MTNAIHQNIGSVAGYFQMKVHDANGNLVRETPITKNLVTNFGLDSIMGSSQNWAANCQYLAVGTSGTTPSVTDVALGAQLGSRSNSIVVNDSGSNSGSPLYYSKVIKTWSFAQGAVVGNVAEVGTFASPTGNNAWTRALVRDGLGNPTTLTVLAGETLSVTYEVRYYPNLTDSSGTITISGTTYNWTKRASTVSGVVGAGISANVIGHNTQTSGGDAFAADTLPTIPADQAGTPFSNATYTHGTYANGSFTRTEQVVWGPTNGNVPGGIGSIRFGKYTGASSYNAGYVMTFSPKIPKTNLQSLTLNFTYTISRHTP